MDEEMGGRREYHVAEVVRHLRSISLHHNPSTMANFLQETVLEKYACYFNFNLYCHLFQNHKNNWKNYDGLALLLI